MVAVVSGSGLGLFGTSASSQGATGSASTGRGNERVFVNTATGNLVIQGIDETLSARGLDVALVRTYNSQGLLNDDNHDNWRLGVHRRVTGLTGTVNTAGSKVTKVFGDAAEIVYSYDVASGRYVSTDGDGAHDSLFWNATNSTWTWTDESSRVTETYDSAGRFAETRDADGNLCTYIYTGAFLTQIVDASGQQTFLDYTGDQLTQIRVISDGATQTLTRYGYDTSGRLSTVTVDLSPENNSVVDGNVYVTSYTYDDDSHRVETITQTDGSSLTFDYQLIDGDYRVHTITDGENRVTTFTYSEVIEGTGGGAGVPATATANQAVLSTTESSSSSADYTIAPGQLRTDDTQVTPYNRNNAVLSTVGPVQIITDDYTLNSGALTIPPGFGWSNPELFDSTSIMTGGAVRDPKVVFDANGNALAMWSGVSSAFATGIYVRRYTRSTNSWSVVQALESNNQIEANSGDWVKKSIAIDAATGNAVVAWFTMASPTQLQLVARRYDAATNTWGAQTQIALTGPAQGGQPSLSINGSAATITWTSSVAGHVDLYASRLSGSSWTAPVLLESLTTDVSVYSAAVDNQGNINVIFGQGAAVKRTRFTASAGTWSAAANLVAVAGTGLKSAIDGNGNGFAIWAQGNDLMMSRYTRSTNAWTAASAIDSLGTAVGAPDLAIDATGNAIVGWTQSTSGLTSAYAKRYNNATSTWSAVQSLESSSQAVVGTVSVSISGGVGAASWLQNDGTHTNVYAANNNGTSWSAAALIESLGTDAGVQSVAIDGQGNVDVMWQSTGENAIYLNRYALNNGAPSYTVPAGATWQSIANALYGVNLAEAGAQLQADMGNPSLVTGAQMIGWPQTLTVTFGQASTVPPYYRVPANPAPPTWRSIAAVVYGVDSAAAGSALQALMQAAYPTLVVNQKINNLPLVLNVSTPITVPPYYLVPPNPATPTWRSVAAAVYGVDSAAAGAALQAQMQTTYPALSVGLHINNLPAILHVTTVTNTTVPAYYVVTSTDWADVTDAVYGTRDVAVIEALQQAAGLTTLTLNMHLAVPLTLNYTTSGGGSSGTAIYQNTGIEDALGFVSSITQDELGRLVRAQSPTVGGTRPETLYTYDADGNIATIVQDPDGLNRKTTFGYDAHGNLILSYDDLGNTVKRTWSATNQLLTETRYAVPDPDGAGSGVATVPLTARFVYDGEDHLRFAISASGRVVEHRYAATGERTRTLQYGGAAYDTSALAIEAAPSLTALTTWTGGQDQTALQRVDYHYDFRGNLDTTTTYAKLNSAGDGVGTPSITRFVYDQRGRLVTSIEARGELTAGIADDYVTSYLYDGMGRLKHSIEWIVGGVLRDTLTEYDDAGRRTTVTLANGLVTTSLFNSVGELVSTSNGIAGDLSVFGTTTYTYDVDGRPRMVTDPKGVRTFSLYDAAGRRVATVDGDGTLSEFVYDHASALVKTIQYAVKLDATALASLVSSNVPQDVSIATLRDGADGQPSADRILRNVYDAVGRLTLSIDAVGAVTQFFYDGAGRVTEEVHFATAVNVARELDALTVDDVSLTSTPEDRTTRHFYDADGNEIATLDSAGYLLEYLRDPAGFLVQQIAYATKTAAQYWIAGTLDQLRPADSDDDIRSHFFHDSQGRQVGVLDAAGYFSEVVYDVAGHVLTTTRYDAVVEFEAGTSTFDSVRSDALAGDAHVSSFTYDGLGRVLTETDFENTTTRYAYDEVGNVLASTRALGTPEERTTESRYDALGRVVQELTAEGHAQITAGMSQSAIDDVWLKYGVTYVYDVAGRRVSSTVRPDDTHTNTSLYFYDDESRLRFEVNALGEVRETRYDAFGQATDSIAYVNRISTAALAGGAIVPVLLDRIATAADPTKDARTTLDYTRRGQVAHSTTAEGVNGAETNLEYDSFGDNRVQLQKIDDLRTLRHEYTYDARGQLTLTRWDPAGLNTTEQRTYDAFGRTISITDARGATTQFEFDRLGRQLATVDALAARSSMTYDAFARTLTSTDRLGNETNYSYDAVARTMTVETPEGVAVVTTHNRHGQTLRVEAAGRTTQYLYDLNGQVLETFDNSGSFGTTTYDRAGRVIHTANVSGATTTLEYDAANRILTRTVDSPADGIQLVTEYVYDGEGRVTQVTEPGGRVTQTKYDREGRVTAVAVDPEGLNLVTTYGYDRTGRVIETIEGPGTLNPRRVVTTFDVLGRRVSEMIDPHVGESGLELLTKYRYDANGNLARKIDPADQSTWFVYDANSQLRFTIDALGGVSEMIYDAAGQVVATRRYADALVEPDSTVPLVFGDVVTVAEITALLSQNDQDRITQSVYDGDGREVFTVNALGGVTERTYDDNGNVTRTRLYARQVAQGAYTSEQQVRDALGAASNPVTLDAADRVSWTAYDLRGRATFAIDGLGAVTQSRYDNAGNVISTTAYATLRDLSLPTSDAALTSWAAGTTVANNAANRNSRYWFDGLDRLRFTLDAEGYLSEKAYDDVQRSDEAISYIAKPAALPAGADLDAVESAAAAARNTGADRYARTEYDIAGRVSRVYDAANNVEEYGYDEVGNKISFRNKNGAEWTYEYDANHRLIFERSPDVEISSVRMLSEGSEIFTNDFRTDTETGQIVTHIEYSALGNVTARTEAYGRPEQRTTRYFYDELGRQISVQQPEVGVYDQFADGALEEDIDFYGRFGRQNRSTFEEDLTLSTFTVYDTLGNAIFNLDVSSARTSNYYDRLGRLRYVNDPEGFTTEYRYDTFGNQTGIVRYDALLDLEPDPVTEEYPVLTADNYAQFLAATPGVDRTLTTEYDRLNRAIRIIQPQVLVFEPTAGAPGGSTFAANPTTQTEFDAFGQMVRQSKLVDPATGLWSSSYFYYDERGKLVGQIDPLGYLTTFEYDAVGNVSRSVEYSHALAAGTWNTATHAAPAITNRTTALNDALGYDRITEYEYNSLNQRVVERSVGVVYSAATAGEPNTVQTDIENTFTYDALGNVFTTTDASGAVTNYFYDDMGRKTGVVAPARDRGDGDQMLPAMRMRYDAFGNIVEQTQFSHSATLAAVPAGYTVEDSEADRISYNVFDAMDRSIITRDSGGAAHFISRNELGDVAREWHGVNFQDGVAIKIYDYDALGRQIRVTEPLLDFQGGTTATQVQHRFTRNVYNTFGEVIERQVYGERWVFNHFEQRVLEDFDVSDEYFEYDAAGRLTRTNTGDGVDKVYLYNLTGQATAQISSRTVNLRDLTLEQVAALDSQRMRMETRYDLAGRSVEQRAPSFAIANPDTELQAIGALLHVGDAVLAPNNPDAAYRLVNTTLDYGDGDVHDIEYPYLDPGADVAHGGGYQYTAPTSANPGGGWTLDPNYALVSGRYIHWTRPVDFTPDNSSRTLVDFEIRPIGGGSFTPVRIVALPGNEVGVNLSGNTAGSYQYRMTYTRRGATEPYAIATGTVTVGATSSLVDTTAATIAGENLAVTSVVTQTPTNTEFLGANFRIGDFNGLPAIDQFVYRRVVTGSLVEYVVDRESTVAQGGGYYRTSTGYEQKADYLPGASRIVRWNAPANIDLTASFEYRSVGDESDWQALTNVTLTGGVYSAAVGSLADGQYEFRISYTSISDPDAPAVAVANGVFQILASDDDLALTMALDPADDAGVVAQIGNRSPGALEVSSSIVASSEFDDATAAGVLFVGQNDVEVRFANTSGAVRIELEYLTQAVDPLEDPGPEGDGWPSVTRRISLLVADGSIAAAGLHLLWSDPSGLIDSGGISAIVAIRVYSVGGDGSAQLRYSSNSADLVAMGGTSLSWKAPWRTDVEATFNVRAVGTTAWQELDVARIAGDFTVDVAGLGYGEWEYEVVHVQNGVTRARSTGVFTTEGGVISNTVQAPPGGVYPAEAFAPISSIVTAPVEFTFTSASQVVTGTPANQPLTTQWDGTNQIALTWDDVGTNPVRVVVDYTSAERYAFNYQGSGTAGWQSSAAFVPGTLTSRTLEFSSAATGTNFAWDDDDSSTVGGISELHRVRVYVFDEDNGWQLKYDRDAGAPRGGSSIYWAKADDPTAVNELRVRAVGSATWETKTVTGYDAGHELADLDSLIAGEYEYQLVRTVQAGGNPVVNSVVNGHFTVPASGASVLSRSLGVTQHNVTLDGTNAFGPVFWDNDTLSWSKAPEAGDTITVRTRLAGTSTWTEQTLSGTGPDFAAPVVVTGSDVVEFEVIYMRSGQSTPYLRAGGLLNQAIAVSRTGPLLTLTQQTTFSTVTESIDEFFNAFGRLTWSEPTASFFDAVTFRVLLPGGTWQELPVESLDDGFAVNLSALPDANYQFEIRYIHPGQTQPFVYASGSLTPADGTVGGGLQISDRTLYSRLDAQQTDPFTPTMLVGYDRWGNSISATDAAGNTTNYRYNQAGVLVETKQPQVAVVDTSGPTVQTRLERPIEKNYFDKLGRLIATMDANGSVSRAQYNEAGQLVHEIAADGGVKSRVFNAFGEAILITDELGYQTSNSYDNKGRLERVERELSLGAFDNFTYDFVSDRYEYNFAGNRILEENSLGERVEYRYNLDGSLRERRTDLGYTTNYAYDLAGNRIFERDANHMDMTWTYDAFGRVQSMTDLSGVVTRYEYDAAGFLIHQTSGRGQDQRFEYDAAGHLTRIDDRGNADEFRTGVVDVNRTTEYGYDIMGRRAIERTIVDNQTHQDTYTTFDAMGRMLHVIDPDFDVTYSYDGASNRTHINANYYNHIGKGPGFVQTQDLWYTYDDMNRVLVSQGVNTLGVIDITAVQGVKMQYNLKGERTSARTNGEHIDMKLTVSGVNVTSVTYERKETGLFTEHYTYDGIGRLIATDQDAFTTTHNNGTGGNTTSTTLLRTSQREFDGASREISSTTFSIDPEEDSVTSLWNTTTTSEYDGDGRAQEQITKRNGTMIMRVTFGTANFVESQVVAVTSAVVRQNQWPGVVRVSSGGGGSGGSTASYVPRTGISSAALRPRSASVLGSTSYRLLPAHWAGTGWDGVGNLRGYNVEYFKDTNGRYQYTANHVFDYRLSDTYQQIGERQNNIGKHSPNDGSTTRTYNVNNELVQFSDKEAKKNNRYFVNNAQGQALTVVQGKFDGRDGRMSPTRAFENALVRTGNKVKAQYYFYSQGQSIGTFGQLADADGTIKANFDVNYTAVSENYPASMPSDVVVQDGDTLRSIAARAFGDSNLWYLLAEENGLTDPNAPLTAGTTIRMPNQVITLANNAHSFKPYDPQAVLGDTTPTPGGLQCKAMSQVIGIVVAMIVSNYAGAVAGAAAGSVAQQYSYLVMNDLYDWTALTRGVLGAFGYGDIFGSTDDMLNPFSKNKMNAMWDQIRSGLKQSSGFGALEYITSSNGSGTPFEMILNDPLALGAREHPIDKKSVVIAAGVASLTGDGGEYVGGLAASATSSAFVGAVVTAAANAVANYNTTYLVTRLAGEKAHWSWRGLADAALMSMAQAGVGSVVGQALDGKVSPGAASFWANVAGSAASASVRALRGGKFEATNIAVDAFANVIGNAMVDQLNGAPSYAPPVSRDDLDEVVVTAQRIQTSLDKNIDLATLDPGRLPTPDERLNALGAYYYENGGGVRPDPDFQYVVQKGDSPARLAREWYGDEKYTSLIMAANGIPNTYEAIHNFQIGKSIVLPALNGLSDETLAAVSQASRQVISEDSVNMFALQIEREERLKNELHFDSSPGLGDRYTLGGAGSGYELGGSFVAPMGGSTERFAPKEITWADAGRAALGLVQTTAKYNLGALEFAGGGLYNGIVGLGGAVGSIPYLIDSVDTARGVQDAFSERYGYELRSEGAKAIANGLGSAVSSIDRNAITPLRDYSTEHIGDAWTTTIFGTVQAGVEIGTLFLGGPELRALGSSARVSEMEGRAALAGIDHLAQESGAVGARFERTEGLGSHSSIAELKASGALPGEAGVTLTDQHVRFGDLYELGTLGDRKIEFSLTYEKVDGALVKRLYSGDQWTVPIPRDARPIAHAHVNPGETQKFWSPADKGVFDNRFWSRVNENAAAAPQPSRIVWGPGNADNTIYWPGFGKGPL